MAVSFAQTRPAFTVKNMYSLHFQCSWTLKTTDASFESNYQIENQMLFHPHTKKDRKKSIYFLHLFSCAHHHMHRTERCHSCEKKLLCMSTQHSAGGRWDCCVCMHVCMYVNAVSLDSCATDTALDRISVLPISVALPLFITRQRDASMVQS